MRPAMHLGSQGRRGPNKLQAHGRASICLRIAASKECNRRPNRRGGQRWPRQFRGIRRTHGRQTRGWCLTAGSPSRPLYIAALAPIRRLRPRSRRPLLPQKNVVKIHVNDLLLCLENTVVIASRFCITVLSRLAALVQRVCA
jgi:hypothetical protein